MVLLPWEQEVWGQGSRRVLRLSGNSGVWAARPWRVHPGTLAVGGQRLVVQGKSTHLAVERMSNRKLDRAGRLKHS